MPPKGYSFWDRLMAEQGVFSGLYPTAKGPDYEVFEQPPNYNVGDVVVGEIVEDA
jgi:hypothetical protein